MRVKMFYSPEQREGTVGAEDPREGRPTAEHIFKGTRQPVLEEDAVKDSNS